MKLYELHTAGNVLLSARLIQLVERGVGKLFLVNGRAEVKRHIVHQE
jgi:hypothetical protein